MANKKDEDKMASKKDEGIDVGASVMTKYKEWLIGAGVLPNGKVYHLHAPPFAIGHSAGGRNG